MGLERRAQAGRRGEARGWQGPDYEIQTAQSALLVTEGFTDQALDAVAVHGPRTNAPRHGDGQARTWQQIGHGVDGEHAVEGTFAVFHHVPNVGATAEARTWAERVVDDSVSQTLTRARPLARLALRTLRPPLVLMRARNPCVLLRLRTLGW